jgi:hypothetical protein
MAFGEVKLIPGLNVEKTPTLNEAGYSATQLIRYLNGLGQKYGGWQRYYPFALSGVPRDLHAWEDLNGVQHLSVAGTTQLSVITDGSVQDITPQTLTSNFVIGAGGGDGSFETTNGSTTVQITDPNITNVTTYDSVLFNTPVSVGGIVISGGVYPIVEVTGTDSYNITVPVAATANVSAGGAVPAFTTTSGSPIVEVTLANHGFTTTGIGVAFQVNFPIATTGNGVTIDGTYTITAVVDANNFNVTVGNKASSNGTFDMNSGDCQLVYYINIGPPATGSGYGLGGYGDGGYGTGAAAGSVQTGTEITSTDWTQDNWGEILMSCPANGGIYLFDPTQGFLNAGLVPNAPIFNNGMFVSTALQMLVAFGTTQQLGIGIDQNPLLISWSDQSNYSQWTPLEINQAGSYVIPKGSMIRAGLAVSNQNMFWTDTDLWVANYLGPPLVWGFNLVGGGAGAISSHAVQFLRSGVYWMGTANFYSYSGYGVNVIPCPVWDAVFQNLNPSFTQNVRSMPNTPFNEVGWLYPSLASVSGECDSYVKFNITEQGNPWDIGPAGTMQRSAWMDESLLGPPTSASSGGLIYSQETTNDADGNPLMASFTTGYFFVTEGEDFAFIDALYPDFKWGTFAGSQTATIQLTVNVVNFPGDTPTVYGPYTVTQSTEFVSVRIRGRQMSFTVSSSDVGSFWRLGKVRYRYSMDGRR